MPIITTSEIPDLARGELGDGVAPTIATHVSAERVARQVEDLGPLPTVALEVMELTDDPNSSARDLQDTISRDAVIAAKVLKMANSAFYSKGRACQTLQEAATRLGTKMIRNLVMGSAVTGMMGRDLPSYAYEPFGLPKHCLALAVLSGELVTMLDLPRHLQDELFLDGLLHDVGKLTLSALVPDTVMATGLQGLERERLISGTDHAAVGVIMGHHWKLPDHAVATIACHHQPATAEEAYERHVAVIHLGDWLLNRHRIGLLDSAEPDSALPDAAALAITGLAVEDLDRFAEEAEGAVERTLQFCAQVL